jgi:hypothetical protein
MAHLRYDASTPGGTLAAKAAAALLDAIGEFRNLKGMADQVGNMGGSFSAANFQGANNVVFDVNVADTQAFFDQITAIDSALTSMLGSNGNEGRIYDLYQAG